MAAQLTGAGLEAAARAPKRPPRLHISSHAIARNWRFFAKIGAAEAGAVVKADAYGMGVPHAVRALAEAGCRTFFVASLGEGLDVRATLGDGPRILVFNGPAEGEATWFRQARLEPVLNTLDQLRLWPEGAFALHVDTGMNRLGLPLSQLWGVDRAPALVMSHLACAADPKHPMNETQRLRFVEAAARFPDAQRSLAASAGALLGPDYGFDLLRPGVGLYGANPFDADGPELATVATLKAPILQIREVEPGDTIGYGATYTFPSRARIATCAVGYADGFLRSLGGKGYAWLRGMCPIRGRVSMDLVTVEVSAVREPCVGEWVEFMGPNVSIDAVARAAGTIAYEVLTNVGARVERVFEP